MLSLIGKIAALYVQRFDDPAAVAAVSEVEQLTTGLSRKIWQKIVLLSQITEFASGSPDVLAEASGIIAERIEPQTAGEVVSKVVVDEEIAAEESDSADRR